MLTQMVFMLQNTKKTTDNIVNRSCEESRIRPTVPFGGKRRATECYVISHYSFQHDAKR